LGVGLIVLLYDSALKHSLIYVIFNDVSGLIGF